MFPARPQHASWNLNALDANPTALRAVAEPGKLSGVGTIAFACLWLLVFAVPWEDAVTISNFGTSARLIGFVAVGFGVLAIFEKGKVRQPAPAHLLMVLFIAL